MSIDIIKNIFKKSSIGTIIFFLLNAFLILSFFAFGGLHSVLIGLLIYFCSILLAFSAVGEWILCIFTGARKMTRIDMKIRMIPLLEIVYNKAKRKTPGLTNKIVLKVIYTPEPNAYAIGRKTICVTEGLFQLPDDVIQGILAHEVAHLALRHTEIQLLIGGGNFLITCFLLFFKVFSLVMLIFPFIFGYRRRLSFGAAFFAIMVWLWTKFCLLFLRWSMRENEYEADKYTFELGFGFELTKGLDAIGASEPQESFLKALWSTHPNTHDRIGRLQLMGVPYYRY